MHGASIQSASPVSRRHSRLQQLREELIIARKDLVEAVSGRLPDGMLAPLRLRVVELLERIERLTAADRFRRMD